MCWYAYIATSKPLTKITFPKENPSDDASPPLHFQEVTEEEDASNGYRSLFKGQYLYYVGTDTGCSCGLERAYATETHDGKTIIDYYNDDSPFAFIDFLKNYTLQEPLELYIVWETDFGKEPLDYIEINAQEVTIDNYLIPVSRQFYTFYSV